MSWHQGWEAERKQMRMFLKKRERQGAEENTKQKQEVRGMKYRGKRNTYGNNTCGGNLG